MNGLPALFNVNEDNKLCLATEFVYYSLASIQIIIPLSTDNKEISNSNSNSNSLFVSSTLFGKVKGKLGTKI
jgi:hypothetical protein